MKPWRIYGKCALIALLSTVKASAEQYAYHVRFTDKHNTPYTLSSPTAFLSARSIARRTAQGIAIDSTDLPVNKQYIDSILTLTGGKLHGVSRWLNSCVILVSDSTLMHALDGKAFVAARALVGYYPTLLHLPPDPQTINSRTQRTTTTLGATYYGNTWLQTNLVNGHTLHENDHKGSGKLIAVLDAGFLNTPSHTGFDSMRNAGRLIDWYNFTLDTTYIYAYDDHGSKALSTMAGYLPGTYVGSAPLASYELYITEDGNSEQPIELLNMMSACERADSTGADIITSSLGYNTFDNPADNFTFADLDGKTTVAAKAANTATQKGILFVASAGNEGTTAWQKILTPGDADSALTVGSVDVAGNNAANSGYGPNAAGQVKPDVCGLGQPANIFVGANSFGTENGTSFSTPQIAGWAACLWHTKPSATPYQVKQAIIRCASRYNTPGNQIGYGIPDFYCTQLVLGTNDPGSDAVTQLVTVTPNPFFEQLYVRLQGNSHDAVSVSLVDVAGRIIATTQLDGRTGNQAIFLPTDNLAAGLYFVKAQAGNQQQVIKLIKQY